MPLQFSTTDQQSRDGVKCGIHGRDGSGKTSLIPTAPRPFIVDVEGKTASIASSKIPSVRIRNWTDWLEFKAWLANSANAAYFDTLFMDSISKLGELSLLFYKQANKDARRAYQEHRDWFSVALTTLLSLPQKHVCLLAWSALVEQPDNTKIYAPSLPGMSAEQSLGYSLNEMFFISIGRYPDPTKLVNGQPSMVEYRYLQTQQDIYVQARDNSRTLQPQESDGPTQPPNLARIFSKIQAGIIVG